jgi:hypothetical protein
MTSLAPDPARWTHLWKNAVSYQHDLKQYVCDAWNYVTAGQGPPGMNDDGQLYNLVSNLGQGQALSDAATAIDSAALSYASALGGVYYPLRPTANSYSDFATALLGFRQNGRPLAEVMARFDAFTTGLGELNDGLSNLNTFAQGLPKTLKTNRQVYLSMKAAFTPAWISDAAKTTGMSEDDVRQCLLPDVLSRLISLDPMAAANIASELLDLCAIFNGMLPKTSADAEAAFLRADPPFDTTTLQSDSSAWQQIYAQCNW